MLLVACPLAAAVAQPHRCETLPAFQREFARAIGACRDLAPIVDVAPRTVKKTPSAKISAPSKTAASRKSEGERGNEPLGERGWQIYRDNRYGFRYPARLVTTSHSNGVLELHSLDREFHMRASSRINSEKDTVQTAWQQRLKEHGQSVTYKRKADGWFVVTGVEDGKTYYRKHFVNPQRTAEFVITYPKSQASVYDPWVIEIERSFVAYRVPDSAQVPRSTEPTGVVTSAPPVNETLELPNVSGRSYGDAANVLTEFKVDRVEDASAAPTGEVLAQDPAPGSFLPPGSAITLRVSDGSLASAAAAVPAPSAASVASASQLDPSTAPVQNDRVAGAFIGGIASKVVAALVAGVLLGLLLGALLMRRALVARSRAIDTAPAEHVDIAPAEIDSGQETAEVHRVAAILPPPEIKLTARLDPGETTIKFTDLPEDEEAAIAGRETTANT
ncbi:MAG: PASTA domain-containing protein [Burkholderiaceae bacterium]